MANKKNDVNPFKENYDKKGAGIVNAGKPGEKQERQEQPQPDKKESQNDDINETAIDQDDGYYINKKNKTRDRENATFYMKITNHEMIKKLAAKADKSKGEILDEILDKVLKKVKIK